MLCPYCSEEIKDGAKKCRYCGEFLEEEEEADKKEKTTQKEEVKKKSETSPFVRGFLQFIIFLFGLIIFLSLSSSSWIFVILTILLCIRYILCSNKDSKVFDFKSYTQPERYKNKTRLIIAGILVVIFGLLSLGQRHDAYKKEKAEQEYKIAYEQAPIPAIQVHSLEGELGTADTYKLEATIKNATEVTVDGEPIEMVGEEISKDYILENPELSIVIFAKNEYKEHSYTVTVSRDRTEEEQAVFEEQQRIEAEKKAKEEEEKRQQVINNQKEEIGDMWKKVDGTITKSYDDVPSITETLNIYDSAKVILNNYSNSEYSEVKQSRANLESKLSATQKKMFPALRTKFCSILKNQLWIDDYEVKCSGKTMTVIHRSFASNSRIAEFEKTWSTYLKRLRFTRLNLKWVEYGEYTYYTYDNILTDGAIW